MASDGHSTICDIDKVDYDNDNDDSKGEEATEDSSNFPEGGLRAWMTVAGRSDSMNHAITGSDGVSSFLFQFCTFG